MYDHQERLEREFAPTLTHLREVEGQIENLKSQLAELQEVQRRLQAIERIIHPPAPKPKAKPVNGAVSETRLQEAIVYLRNNYEPDENIYASLLEQEESWSPSPSQTTKILAILHERGQLRLDSKGIGGRKNFRVVE